MKQISGKEMSFGEASQRHPQGLNRLREEARFGGNTRELCVRARLQPCRKCRKINVGFSPWGMLLAEFTFHFLFFRSL